MARIIGLFFTNLLSRWLEDIFILIGFSFFVYTTYGINTTAGNYLVGFLFLLFGFILAKK